MKVLRFIEACLDLIWNIIMTGFCAMCLFLAAKTLGVFEMFKKRKKPEEEKKEEN